jgi:hypothetical protein
MPILLSERFSSMFAQVQHQYIAECKLADARIYVYNDGSAYARPDARRLPYDYLIGHSAIKLAPLSFDNEDDRVAHRALSAVWLTSCSAMIDVSSALRAAMPMLDKMTPSSQALIDAHIRVLLGSLRPNEATQLPMSAYFWYCFMRVIDVVIHVRHSMGINCATAAQIDGYFQHTVSRATPMSGANFTLIKWVNSNLVPLSNSRDKLTDALHVISNMNPLGEPNSISIKSLGLEATSLFVMRRYTIAQLKAIMRAHAQARVDEHMRDITSIEKRVDMFIEALGDRVFDYATLVHQI